MLTFFVSSQGIEEVDNAFFKDRLQKEDLVNFISDRRYLSASRIEDAAGNDVWSINVVVGDEHNTFVSGGPNLRKYEDPPKEEIDSRT